MSRSSASSRRSPAATKAKIGTATVDDSLIRTVPGTTTETALSGAISQPVSGANQLTARHDTLIGDGSTGSVGLLCTASTGVVIPISASCIAAADSTIFRGFQHAIYRAATADTYNAGANVNIDYSDLDPSTDVDGPNTSASGGVASGTITLGAHNVNVDPAFVSTDPMNAKAFQLSAASPMIDNGNPVLGAGESTTDLAGNPRVVVGRTGDAAISDIGAFEFQPTVASTQPPAISNLTVKPHKFKVGKGEKKKKRGTLISYTDSQAASATLTIYKVKKHGKLGRVGSFTRSDTAGPNSFRFSGRVGGHKLKPGRYQLQVVSKNANGTSNTATVSFTVKGK